MCHPPDALPTKCTTYKKGCDLPVKITSILSIGEALLHRDRQIHAWMNGAIQVKSAAGGEGANRLAATALDSDRLHRRRTSLLRGFGCTTAIPATILNNMYSRNIIDQVKALTLLDCNSALHK